MKTKSKEKIVRCPYCGKIAVLKPSSYIYGECDKSRYLYVCSGYPACNAYVRADDRTKLPLGSLANGELRHKRIEAHRAFDMIWRSGIMTRSQAYQWMQAKFGLHKSCAHIACFSEYMCSAVVSESNKVLVNHHLAS